MKIKSIIDIITNSSSEVYVIKNSSLQEINEILKNLGVTGIGEVIKFDLSRYRDWQNGKFDGTWDEKHYFLSLREFLDTEDPESIKHYTWRYIEFQEDVWVPYRNGSAKCIQGEKDKFQIDYKKSRLDFDTWYEKKKSQGDLPRVKDILSRTVYQITIQDIDGLFITGSIDENTVSSEDINKIINNLNATRYFI